LGSGWARRFSSLSRRLTASVIGLAGFAAGDVGGGYEPDFLADVVEGEHFVEEEQAGVGNAELVGGERGQALDLADRVVGEEADGSGGEGGRPGRRAGLWPARAGAGHEDVVLDLGDLFAFSDGDLAAAGDDALEGR
jgi:hypothetical protein